jgi:hypothetical protein
LKRSGLINYADANSWIAELVDLSYGHRSGPASWSDKFLFDHLATALGLLPALIAVIYP